MTYIIDMRQGTQTKPTPTDEMLAAYEHGKTHRDDDLMTLAYSDDGDYLSGVWECPVLNLFWTAGCEDEPIPQWVTAERYGDLPETGVSRNYTDNRAERGVSVARLLDHDDDYEWHMGGFGGDSRPVIKVEGWLHFERGGDGEPLLVGARRR